MSFVPILRSSLGHSAPAAIAATAYFDMHFGYVQGRSVCALHVVCHKCTISMGMFLVTRFEKGLGEGTGYMCMRMQ